MSNRELAIGISCYPTFGGSGVVATEIGMAMAKRGHRVHFICYDFPRRLPRFTENISALHLSAVLLESGIQNGGSSHL